MVLHLHFHNPNIIYNMYASKVIKAISNMALLAMAALCTAFLCGCDSSNTMSNLIDNIRPSAHFRVVDFRVHGDTLTYYRVRYPKPLR